MCLIPFVIPFVIPSLHSSAHTLHGKKPEHCIWVWYVTGSMKRSYLCLCTKKITFVRICRLIVHFVCKLDQKKEEQNDKNIPANHILIHYTLVTYYFVFYLKISISNSHTYLFWLPFVISQNAANVLMYDLFHFIVNNAEFICCITFFHL